MALRDILLHMSDDDLAQSRLDVALKLAQMHEAHLTALYVVRTVEIPTYVRAYIDEEILQAGQNRQLELAKDAEKAFLDQTSRNGISAEWRVAIGEDRELMNLHGRYADLAVVSQRHFATDVSSNSDNLAEEFGFILLSTAMNDRAGAKDSCCKEWRCSQGTATFFHHDTKPHVAKSKTTKVFRDSNTSPAKLYHLTPGISVKT